MIAALLDGIDVGIWTQVKDGHPRFADLYRRHYSCHQYIDNRRSQGNYRNRDLVMGPGSKMCLLTPDWQAAFGWRKFKDASGQQGINCAFFRNESSQLSSWLILEAEKLAWARWPGERLYTYVNAGAIKSSNPGYCYLRACWQKCGFTQTKRLVILEKFP